MSAYIAGDLLTADEVVAWFNETHALGTSVTYYPGVRGSRSLQGTTRTPAWVLPSGEPVVSITGYAGGIHLSHVICARHAAHAQEGKA